METKQTFNRFRGKKEYYDAFVAWCEKSKRSLDHKTFREWDENENGCRALIYDDAFLREHSLNTQAREFLTHFQMVIAPMSETGFSKPVSFSTVRTGPDGERTPISVAPEATIKFWIDQLKESAFRDTLRARLFGSGRSAVRKALAKAEELANREYLSRRKRGEVRATSRTDARRKTAA